MDPREPTYDEAVELLHRTHEALVLDVMNGEQAFGLLRSGATVMFPVEEPVAKHSVVHVRPCAAWLGEDGRSVRLFACRLPTPRPSALSAEQAAEMDRRARGWQGHADIWEDPLDQVGGWFMDLAAPVDEEDELERWARRMIEARVERHAPVGSSAATFEEALAGARAALLAVGFRAEPGGYDPPLGIFHFLDPRPLEPWFVAHGTGAMDERDGWRGGLVDLVMRRFGFVTAWFGDPQASIEVVAFRPAGQLAAGGSPGGSSTADPARP